MNVFSGKKTVENFLDGLNYLHTCIISMWHFVICLLSGLMLLPRKKCHNSGHQSVALGITAFLFFHFISNTFRVILTVPSKQGFCNDSIVKSKSNFSMHFSKCFVTVPNTPITFGITSTFLIFQIFAISYFSSL